MNPTNEPQVPDRIWIRPTGYGSVWSPTKLHWNDAEYARATSSPEATRQAEDLVDQWYHKTCTPSFENDAELDTLKSLIAQALTAAVGRQREADAVIAETHSATDCDGPDCGVVIAAAIRASKE